MKSRNIEAYKAKKLVAFLMLFPIFLSGCSFTQTGIEGLLSPPRLSQQQNAIYTALESAVGKGITLVYPRKGDFTSAFLINNIDNEATQEAIVFYESTTSNTSTRPLRVNVLDQEGGKWVSKYEIGVEASQVEKVNFITLNQRMYIIVGYNTVSKSEKHIALYTYADGVLEETYSGDCMDYVVGDLDGDNESELLTFVQSKGDVKQTTANLHKINNYGTKIIASTHMDPNVTEYAKISHGKMKNGNAALYVDGLKGTNSLCTEILTMEHGMLLNLIYFQDEEKNLIDKTLRPYGRPSMDLDGDSVFEIPTIRAGLGYENAPNLQKQYLTDWYSYAMGELLLKKTTYVSYLLGYMVTIPSMWNEKVKIDYLSASNELIFYDFSKIDDYDAKLLSIKVVRRTDYNSAKTDGYSLLKDNGQLMYTYKIFDSRSELKVSEGIVKNMFSLV